MSRSATIDAGWDHFPELAYNALISLVTWDGILVFTPLFSEISFPFEGFGVAGALPNGTRRLICFPTASVLRPILIENNNV